MNLKQLYQKPIILPALMILTYLSLLLETIKYPGFVGNHFLISAKVYFALALFLLIFLNTGAKLMKFVFRVNRILLIAFSVVYITLNLIEGAHYTNYVLNFFHLHLDGMIYLVLFSFLVFIIEKFKHLIPNSVGKLGIIYPAMIFSLVFFGVSNMPYVFDMAFARDSYIVFHLNSSYDDKMFYQWGKFYRFMVFVKNNTPTDSTIVLPPMEDPWLMGSGNPHFVRAFLHPRKIVQETKIISESDLKKYGSNTYILVTWGKEVCKPDPECHGWPRQDIPAKKIIYEEPDSVNAAEVKENLIYKLGDSKYVYGVIEL